LTGPVSAPNKTSSPSISSRTSWKGSRPPGSTT
jgi:hypothetical protein